MRAILLVFLLLTNVLYCGGDDYVDEGYREFLTEKEALEWGNSWLRGSIFSDDEKEVILKYSKTSWTFNEKLRGGEKFENLPQEEQELIKRLDKAVGKFPLFEKLYLFRYVNLDVLASMYGWGALGGTYEEYEESDSLGIKHKKIKFNKKIKDLLKDIKKRRYIDPGFMSTTMVKDAVFGGRPIELKIKIPVYTTGLFIARDGYTFFIKECEILFPRNRTLFFEGYSLSEDGSRLTLYAKMKGPWWYVKDDKK
ncbi:ADP-ribosyltransferase [Helicobacter brantae]|nr:ADP-ribosyltransferase [Helicobacter brantae]